MKKSLIKIVLLQLLIFSKINVLAETDDNKFLNNKYLKNPIVRGFIILGFAGVAGNYLKKYLQTECPICMQDDKYPWQMAKLSCGHTPSCKDCLRRQIQENIRSKNPTYIHYVNGLKICSRQISADEIAELISDPEYPLKLEETLKFLKSGKKNCPTPNCDGFFENAKNERKPIKCEKCGEKYCAICLSEHNMYESIKCEIKSEKKCPSCSTLLEKTRDCNHMTCPCGYEFCWVCSLPYRPSPTCDCPKQ